MVQEQSEYNELIKAIETIDMESSIAKPFTFLIYSDVLLDNDGFSPNLVMLVDYFYIALAKSLGEKDRLKIDGIEMFAHHDPATDKVKITFNLICDTENSLNVEFDDETFDLTYHQNKLGKLHENIHKLHTLVQTETLTVELNFLLTDYKERSKNSNTAGHLLIMHVDGNSLDLLKFAVKKAAQQKHIQTIPLELNLLDIDPEELALAMTQSADQIKVILEEVLV